MLCRILFLVMPRDSRSDVKRLVRVWIIKTCWRKLQNFFPYLPWRENYFCLITYLCERGENCVCVCTYFVAGKIHYTDSSDGVYFSWTNSLETKLKHFRGHISLPTRVYAQFSCPELWVENSRTALSKDTPFGGHCLLVSLALQAPFWGLLSLYVTCFRNHMENHFFL